MTDATSYRFYIEATRLMGRDHPRGETSFFLANAAMDLIVKRVAADPVHVGVLKLSKRHLHIKFVPFLRAHGLFVTPRISLSNIEQRLVFRSEAAWHAYKLAYKDALLNGYKHVQKGGYMARAAFHADFEDRLG